MARVYQLHGAEAAGLPDFAAELNPQQLEAVTNPGGYALVIAGAGSGKTRTLTYRVAWLLGKGEPPRSILLLTFTNKAAREMLERVAGLVPSGADGIWGGTFHSVGNRILRRHPEAVGFREGFSIMDREDSEDLIASVVAREGLDGPERRFPKAAVLADIFSYSVNTAQSVRAVLGARYQYFIPLAGQIEHAQVAYEIRKREANVMDFDDLLTKTLELLTTHPEIAGIYQDQFRHILVDEFQDTNRIQSALVEALAARHGNVMVVGDDAQSIYSWRGANFENILGFPKRHAGAAVYKIETNYRSVPGVLEVANAAIRANERQFPKNLSATREAAALKPALVPLSTNTEQAAFVAQRVLELHEEGLPLDEIAVLYRAHFHSMEVQLEFTRRGIPFSITSGLRFFEQAHIKDVAAFLKFAVNPRDEVAFKRLARLLPGIGAKSAESLWAKIRAGGAVAMADLKVPAKATKAWAQLAATVEEIGGGKTPPAQMIDAVMFALYDEILKEKFPNYEARKEDIGTLAAYARDFENAADFLDRLALLAGPEVAEALAGGAEPDGKVVLSTIHQAKGLEWKAVFLIYLTEGMFPHSRSNDREEDIEEERRLFYVGLTRCKDELYLTYPDIRLNAGYGEAFQRPSRFLSEIPPGLIEEWEVNGGERAGADADAPF